MTRVAWATDIHLDLAEPPARQAFYDQLAHLAPQALLLGGDIAEAPHLVTYLRDLADALPCPIYFVLGNHDYYRGSIARVRSEVQQLCAHQPRLVYLTSGGVCELAPGLALVGHDGWADARLGDYLRSYVMMNDYKLIAELAQVNKEDRWPLLKRLGDEAAADVAPRLRAAAARYPRVWFLTHVPPFREACWYEGQISNDEWLPHFTCQALGQVLRDVAFDHPECELTVYCGHTHSAGRCQPLPNLRVYTAAAQYGHPAVQQVPEKA